jgi:hypothetical protein
MTVTIALLLYKIVSLLVGLFFAYMGYRLFMAGVWGQAGELDAQFGNNKILLKKGAPGTFFALFGTVIVAFTIWRGLDISTTTTTELNSLNKVSQSSLSKPDNNIPEIPESLPEEGDSK